MAEIRLIRREADGLLPNVCMVCGRDSTIIKNKRFSWNPSWVWITLLAGLLPFLIIALITTKSAKVQAPLCRDHRFHWALRASFVVLGLFSFLVLAFVAFGLDAPRWLLLMLLVCFIVWLTGAIVLSVTSVRPKVIDDHHITLVGVAPAFVDAVLAQDEPYDEPIRRPRRIHKPASDPYLAHDRDDVRIQNKRSRPRPHDDAIEE